MMVYIYNRMQSNCGGKSKVQNKVYFLLIYIFQGVKEYVCVYMHLYLLGYALNISERLDK